MKKVLILISFIALPLISVGQNNTSDALKQNDSTTTIKTDEKTVLSSEMKAEVNEINYKKSNDIISIKAYRKSLQIKVKEIKNC